jgi:hypothetical protein
MTQLIKFTIVLLFIVYGCICFVTKQINPFNWSYAERYSLVLITMLSSFLTWAFKK